MNDKQGLCVASTKLYLAGRRFAVGGINERLISLSTTDAKQGLKERDDPEEAGTDLSSTAQTQ